MKIAIIGLGSRGRIAYLQNLVKYPDVEITALCDLNRFALDYAAQKHAPNARLFNNEEEFFGAGKLADCLIIATQDKDHYRHAKSALLLGYDLLLEKPVTANPAEFDELLEISEQKKARVLVCHVLRYAPFYIKIKELLDKGEIGKVVSINHQENIAYWHFAHSYARGNWHKEADSSPMIIAKCCHDFDLLYWLIGAECKSLSSYGNLFYFQKDFAPSNSTATCLENCPEKPYCLYNAERIYTSLDPHMYWRRFQIAGKPNPTTDEVREALKTNPYGKCVFRNDNDVNDHQVVAMNFENGVTATLSACAFTKSCHRRIHIMGTEGEIEGSDMDSFIKVSRFDKILPRFYPIRISLSGHLGGDAGLADTLHSIMKGEPAPADRLTTLEVTAISHRMAYAAIESSKTGKTVEL